MKKTLILVLFLSSRFVRSRMKQFLFIIIGISLGVCAFVVSASVMYGYEKYFIKQVIEIEPHISIRPKITRTVTWGDYTFVEILGDKERYKESIVDWREIVEAISEIAEVKYVMPRYEVRAILKKGDTEKGVTIIGIDPNLEQRSEYILRYIKEDYIGALSQWFDGILLGIDLYKSLNLEGVGQRVTLMLPNGKFVYVSVIGNFETGITSIDNNRVIANIRFLQNLFGGSNEINSIAIFVSDPKNVNSIVRYLQNFIIYDIEPWTKAFSNFLRVLKTQNFMTMFIVSIILIVSAFGIFGINLIIVLEKRKELAIMQAIGVGSRSLILTFLFIAMFVAVIGFSVGSFLSLVVLNILEKLEIGMGATVKVKGFVLDRSIKYYLYSLIFVLISTFLASIYPAYKAGRVNPVEVFRSL